MSAAGTTTLSSSEYHSWEEHPSASLKAPSSLTFLVLVDERPRLGNLFASCAGNTSSHLAIPLHIAINGILQSNPILHESHSPVRFRMNCFLFSSPIRF